MIDSLYLCEEKNVLVKGPPMAVKPSLTRAHHGPLAEVSETTAHVANVSHRQPLQEGLAHALMSPRVGNTREEVPHHLLRVST